MLLNNQRSTVLLLIALAGASIPAFSQFRSNATATVGTLPAASSNAGKIYDVSDPKFPGDCWVGGGVNANVRSRCISNGTVWYSANGDAMPFVTPEQFGARGDANCFTGAGTDDTAPISAALTYLGGLVTESSFPVGGAYLRLRAGTCYRVTNTLTIANSNVHIIGDGARSSIIVQNGNLGNDTLDINSAGSICTVQMFNRLEHFGIRRSAEGTGTSKGIYIHNSCWTQLTEVESFDAIYDFYVYDSANTVFDGTQAYWQNNTSTTRYMYYLSSTNGSPSIHIKKALGQRNGSGVTGLGISGGLIADLQIDYFGVNGADYCAQITSTQNGTTTNYNNDDLHLNHFVCDAIANTGVLITNVYGGGKSHVEIGSGYFSGAYSTTKGIDCENCQGLNLHDNEINSFGTCVLINGSNSANNTIDNNHCNADLNGVFGTGSAASTNVTQNVFRNLSDESATAYVNIAFGSANWLVTGNQFQGIATNAIVNAGTSTIIGPNQCTGTVTNCAASDSGTATAYVSRTFFGTAPPGSVAGNLPGDLFSDTTGHHLYRCDATVGTNPPACSSVTVNGWTQTDAGTIPGQTFDNVTSRLTGDVTGSSAANTVNSVKGKAVTTPTTKGDLMVYDGAGINRLAAGTDTQVLTADSTQTTGLKWAAGGGSVNVNGSSVSSPNFNMTTPATEAGYQNVKWQVSSSNVSGEISQTNQVFNTNSSLGTSTGSGQYIPGSSLTPEKLYYQGASGLTLAKADSSTTVPGICISISTTQCVYSGTYRFSATQSWTVGGAIYVSDATAGSLTQTAPTTTGHFVQRVGIALAADIILIMPSIDVGRIQ